MIISDQNKSSKKEDRKLFTLLLAIIVLFALAYLAMRLFSSIVPPSAIRCDAEQVIGNKFVQNGVSFDFGNCQSDEASRSGSYSCKLDTSKQYGIQYELKDPVPGTSYKASIWRLQIAHTPASLVVSGKKIYKFSNLANAREDSGWELLEVYFQVPTKPIEESIKIYAYMPYGKGAYFDDLKIEKVKPFAQFQSDTIFSPKAVNLAIDDKGMKKLLNKREEAFRNRILISADDDWVKANFTEKDENHRVSLRLKGDWTDHLQGDKWSYRIKFKSDESWDGFKTISFQNPSTRSFLKEWVFHELLIQEDILTPRYDFMSLSVNEKSLGVYAFEEHFDKQLVESQNRREGPILRFVEDAFWLSTQRQFNAFDTWVYTDQKEKTLNDADIEPFKSGKTAASGTLSKQFQIAQSLLYAYKRGLKPAKEIFDLERMAKYYAITDITRAYHGITWINMRVYYNPVISKLEPIGYDGYGEIDHPLKDGLFLADDVYKQGLTYKKDEAYRRLFFDADFIKLYFKYLYEFTEPAYMEQFILAKNLAIDKRSEFIKQEFNNYTYDKTTLITQAKKIRNLVLPYNQVNVKFRKGETKDGIQELQATNFHICPIEIRGYGSSNRKMANRLAKKTVLYPNAKNVVPTFTPIDIPESANYVFFGVPGIDSTFWSPISLWNNPDLNTPQGELFSDQKLVTNDFYQVLNDSLVVFTKGKKTVKEDLIIPAGYEVSFEPGVDLDFVQNAKFISKSPVFMIGLKDDPIRIQSSDRTGNGFTVLQSNKRSALQYVLFQGMNTLNYKGWMLTGAVTFYESDVDINYCSFTDNDCEDGLNIVRANFTYKNSLIARTKSDGFDADFCEGYIENAEFQDTGNDGIDFSGSAIQIESVMISNAGDKGISIGEAAKVRIKNATVKGAVIGAASKDKSELIIQNLVLDDCLQGLALYQKKPEFGSSKMVVKQLKGSNLKFTHKVEPGSILILNGKTITGD